MSKTRVITALVLLGVLDCVDSAPARHGEARITVDVDLPVRLANRLRVDVYSGDGGRWYASTDVAMLTADRWPTSFGVYDPGSTGTALVRLRVYPSGVTRDYHGERFAPRPDATDPGQSAIPPAPVGELPRLIANGADQTPRTEPEPTATVDRLVRVRLTPGRSQAITVVLRGACAGTMADLAQAMTCVDRENERVTADHDDGDDPIPTSSLSGTFGPKRGCALAPRAASFAADGTPLFDEEVCIPGGSFLFGGRDRLIVGDRSSRPERIVIEPPFLIDKHEMTVGRVRRALADGYQSQLGLGFNEGPLTPGESKPTSCTFSATPRGRERYPVNCINIAEARALCQFLGGDLPSETQLEMAAAARDLTRAMFPWGDEFPTCSTAVFARVPMAADCRGSPLGPLPEDDPASDVALSGVVNLGGGVAEMTSDSFRSLSSRCWASAALTSPRCTDPTALAHTMRGGSWTSVADTLAVSNRSINPISFGSVGVGFRCARRGE